MPKRCNTVFGIAVVVLIAANSIWSNVNQRSFNRFIQVGSVVRNMLAAKKKSPEDIKYAAFGTSITWGATTSNPEKHAYVKLLSQDATNLAIRGTGPNYPSACTQSMVGNKEFDVIILEYFVVLKFGLRTLTRRLRERFPDALIIILREWYPLLITNQDGVSAKQWAEQKFGHGSLNDPLMHQAFIQSKDVWKWSAQDGDRAAVQNKIALEYNVNILVLPKPKDARNWVYHSHLFAHDYLHKSNMGHEEVANRVRAFVESRSIPVHPKIGTWSNDDLCSTWFETGKLPKNRFNVDSEFSMMQFPNTDKHALEFNGKKGESGKVRVVNPSQEAMNVYVAYMVTGPPPSKYPRIKVSISGSNQKPVILDQDPPSYYGGQNIHVHKIKEIGSISHGRTILKFEQLEDTEYPFRFVSVAVTNQDLKFSAGGPLESPKY